MKISNYGEFVQLVEKYRILPFSEFVPEYPSLTATAADNHWHTGNDTDPWLWRVRIAQEGIAAYGKFFNAKAAFIHTQLFPAVRIVLTSNKTIHERYSDGLISRTAYHIYKILSEHSIMDSRNLRKETGLSAKEDKKEYEKSLVELQNSGDVIITGAAKNDNDLGWSSMCYQPSELWLDSVQINREVISVDEAKNLLKEELVRNCSSKSLGYFARKLKFEVG